MENTQVVVDIKPTTGIAIVVNLGPGQATFVLEAQELDAPEDLLLNFFADVLQFRWNAKTAARGAA